MMLSVPFVTDLGTRLIEKLCREWTCTNTCTVSLHDTGAHGFAMGYNYNGRLKSAEILLQEDGSTRMIRRAETPEDYFATIEGFDF